MGTTLGDNLATFNSSQDSVQLAQASPTALAAAIATLNIGQAIRFGAGTGTGKISTAFSAKAKAVAAGTPASLNLNTGLVDALNNAIALPTAKAIIFQAAADNTADMTLTGNFIDLLCGASGCTMTLHAGELFKKIDPTVGYTVTPSSADTITVTSASGTQKVDILIAG